MGSAIAGRIKSTYPTYVFEKDAAKTVSLGSLTVAKDSRELVLAVDAVVLAVKPQDFDALLDEIRDEVSGKLIISIAAGIPTAYIQKVLGEVRVIRVMPNLPARIGLGMICLCKGSFAEDTDLEFVRQLFDTLGSTLVIEEGMMDAATAIAGSGPGFFYELISGNSELDVLSYASEVFIPDFSLAAESLGFGKSDAELLVTTVSAGSIALLKQTAFSAQELCRQVTSKGGTTEAGLAALRKSGSLVEAAKAAEKRAKELSRGG